ncbi:hypothetical protein NQ317_009104 [Molorchus minor]|uniref:Beta-glucuronidase n=1 Tax=Molorchus minor TaxID=1323400 RepID=A0ABQ9JA05_9CUCU|nr:hypothetical protein NQ317_009104 [Molorchus minor]
MRTVTYLLLLTSLLADTKCGILDPRHARRRPLITLDGLWGFSFQDSNNSVDAGKEIELMPVPASYNDISTNPNVRDYVGVVRYQRSFFVPSSWQTKRIWLRFGSVCYSAEVYINGELAITHQIGHLPFVGEVTSLVKVGDDNDIVVYVDNTLTGTSIPQGSLETLPSGRIKQDYTFDFFNYAGIDRPVVLYATESTYIDDITIHTKLNGTTGIVSYDITIEGSVRFTNLISIVDKEGTEVATNDGGGISGDLEIPNVHLWWPYLMSDDPGYLYTLKVDLFDSDSNLMDRYELPFGVRELSWDSTSFKINGKPLYIRGFGRHEDSDFRGKGLDLPLVLRDYALIKWMGANCYRTSHYPYAEEIMDLADSLGIMIIDEVPAVNTDDFNDDLLENHKRSITETIRRDKNRPAVVMWSAANEPKTADDRSEDYYRHVIAHVKAFDQSRPVTIANLVGADADHSGQFLDILSFNEYSAWYSHEGDLEVIYPDVMTEAQSWHTKYNKPVLVTEYGADTLEGFHMLPSFVWSEEYQSQLLEQNFRAFDDLRGGRVVYWGDDLEFRGFQDQARRLGGNKKGIFTRQRQPKQSAHHMRKRYWAIAALLDNATLPKDLDNYIIGSPIETKDEL